MGNPCARCFDEEKNYKWITSGWDGLTLFIIPQVDNKPATELILCNECYELFERLIENWLKEPAK